MLIDWFTVTAQVINFLVLLFLLKKFLYGPILRAMAEREKMIAGRLKEAEEAKTAAAEQAAELEKETAMLRSQKEQILAKTTQEVRQWQETELDRIKEEINALRQSWQESLASEKDRFAQQLKTRIAKQIVAISDKVIRDLTDGSFENRLVDAFVQRMKDDAVQWKGEPSDSQITFEIRTGFGLDEDHQEKLRHALALLIPSSKQLAFSVDPDYGYGIQLHAGDWKLEWSLAWYLKGLKANIFQSL